MCSCHSILEYSDLFSRVKLSISSFCFIPGGGGVILFLQIPFCGPLKWPAAVKQLIK